jgi:hypothetical protein
LLRRRDRQKVAGVSGGVDTVRARTFAISLACLVGVSIVALAALVIASARVHERNYRLVFITSPEPATALFSPATGGIWKLTETGWKCFCAPKAASLVKRQQPTPPAPKRSR